MKFNIYVVIAIAIIGTISGSLAASLDDIEPALSAAILMFLVLVLGWGAGRLAGRAEIDRLTSIETVRRIQANCLIVTRNRLESELEQLRGTRAAISAEGDGHAA